MERHDEEGATVLSAQNHAKMDFGLIHLGSLLVSSRTKRTSHFVMMIEASAEKATTTINSDDGGGGGDGCSNVQETHDVRYYYRIQYLRQLLGSLAWRMAALIDKNVLL